MTVMSKANPFIPEELSDIQLAADMRRLANRITDQASRFSNEHARNPLAALFTVGLAFNTLARDLRMSAEHVQPNEPEAPKTRTCNMHDDCDAADLKAQARNGKRAAHCHSDDCEDCFGK